MTSKNSSPWVSGVVVHGDGRGKKLGFPTANLVLDEPSLRPSEGIHVCWARTPKLPGVHKAVLHVGPRPVFSDARITVELHFLDIPADTDLYEQRVEFLCVKKLREVQNFATIEELIIAIDHDCAQASEILSSQKLPSI